MIKPLTSLRFIFAFMVFMSHRNIYADSKGSFLHHLFYEGYAGVSFFFMLSGFILAYSYQQRLTEKSTSMRQFYVARIARIYPLHLLALLCYLYLNRFFNHCTGESLLELGVNTFLLQSFIPGQEFKFNPVSWSLSDEAFFYLLFPFIIAVLPRLKRWLYPTLVGVATIIVATAFFLIDNPWENWVLYINPLYRLFDFTLGIVIYNLCLRINLSKSNLNFTAIEIGAVLLVVGFYLLAYFIPNEFRQSVWYWIPMGLLIATFYFQRGKISQFLSHRTFVKLGEISFAFYLFHCLSIHVCHIIFAHLHIEEAAPICDFLTSLMITLIAAFVSHQYIEVPANRFIRKRFSK